MIREIFRKVRKKGLFWLIDRIAIEVNSPKTSSARRLSKFMKHPFNLFVKLPIGILEILAKRKIQNDSLLFIYDLRIEPLTFNFLWALSAAHYKCIRSNISHLDVLIVYGEKEGVREECEAYEKICPASSRRRRIVTVLIESCRLVPKFRQLYCVEKNDVSNIKNTYESIYPENYMPKMPITHYTKDVLVKDGHIKTLRAESHCLRYMQNWLDYRSSGRRVITITLRDYDYDPLRNSNIEEWLKFANSCAKQEYYIVFIPDAENSYKYTNGTFEGFDVCLEASQSVGMRMALYELSNLCLGVNNGVMALCWFSPKVKYIMFKILTENVDLASKQAIERIGLKLYENPVFVDSKFQKWVWENDTSEVISREVNHFFSKQTESYNSQSQCFDADLTLVS